MHYACIRCPAAAINIYVHIYIIVTGRPDGRPPKRIRRRQCHRRYLYICIWIRHSSPTVLTPINYIFGAKRERVIMIILWPAVRLGESEMETRRDVGTSWYNEMTCKIRIRNTARMSACLRLTTPIRYIMYKYSRLILQPCYDVILYFYDL